MGDLYRTEVGTHSSFCAEPAEDDESQAAMQARLAAANTHYG